MAATNPNTNPTYATTGTAGTAARTNPNANPNANYANNGAAAPTTTTTTGTAPAAAGGAGTGTGTTSAGHSAASGIKGVFAGIHGAGEALRGTVNSAVDEIAGDSHGKVKNDNITIGGVNEMESGNFTVGTKNREGAIPGDHERRY